MSVNPEVLTRISSAWRNYHGRSMANEILGPAEEPAGFFTEDAGRRYSIVDPIITRAMSGAVEDIEGLPHYKIAKQFVGTDRAPFQRPAVLYTAQMFEHVPTDELPEKILGSKNVSLLYTPGIKQRRLPEVPEVLTAVALPGVETGSFRELSRSSFVTYDQFMDSVKQNIATIPVAPFVKLEWYLNVDPEDLSEAVFNITRIATLFPQRTIQDFP